MNTMLALLLALAQDGGHWPQFRGPTGLGLTADKRVPLKWSATENVRWKAALPGEGHASPVVWGDRVFTCTVAWAGGKPDKAVIPVHHVTCFSAVDGKVLWDTVVEPGPWRREDFRSGAGGGYAAPTPCTDGKRVYVVFGSAVMASIEIETGALAWRHVLKPHSFDVTIGSSPILHGETVILLFAMANKADSRVAAFGKADGALVWETKMPKTGFGHSTPLLIDVKGRRQLVTVASGAGNMAEALMAFDPADGKRLWWCAGAGDASSPAYGGGILYADSGRGGQGTALDPTGEGDLTATHVKWTAGGMPESIGSPIIVGGHVFRILGSGEVKVWQLSDGQQTDRAKLGKLGSTWASPISDGERIWFASGGRSVVVKAGAKVEILAENDLGDANHASPAVSNGRLYLLGLKSLWCVGP
jgi:outer membrane protein assembly factor BamB